MPGSTRFSLTSAGRYRVRVRDGRLRAWLRSRATLPREVLVLGIIAFCVMLGFGVVIPVLPVFARSFGVGNFEVGMVVSVFALMRLITSPFTGRLIALAGERLTLAIGIYVVAASSAAAGFAHSYPQLLIMRGLGGIGSAMFTVAAMTVLLNSVEPARRGRAQGFFQGGFLLGGMAGPAVGGLLAQISLTAPFFFYAATLAVAGTVGLVLLRPSLGPVETTGAQPVRQFSEVLRDRGYQAALLTNFANGWNSFGVRSSLIPVLVVEVLHRDPSWTGITFAIAAVAQTIALAPAGRFVDTVGRRPAMVIGSTLAALSMLAIAVVPNIWLLTVALCLYSVGSAFLGTAPPAAVGDAAGARSGTPVAVFSMVADIGAIAGPLAAGFLADHASMPVAFVSGAALLVLSALISLRMAPGIPAPPARTPDPAPAAPDTGGHDAETTR